MPYLEEEWTDEQKALVMADESLMCVVEAYNKMIEMLKTNPEGKQLVKTMKFSASHAIAIRDYYVRPSVPKSIWIKVDADAKKKDIELEEIIKKREDLNKKPDVKNTHKERCEFAEEKNFIGDHIANH